MEFQLMKSEDDRVQDATEVPLGSGIAVSRKL